MSHLSELIATDIEAYLEQHRVKELLRLLTCGSVDDGKSTLIGRLLHDSHLIYEDQLAAVRKDSARHGTTGDGMDLALLVDGLKAEREQGITIDVAYRYFSTSRRKFIIADCPGHEEYTRNMATGASNCDLAVILIDARKGVLAQTRRHSFIVSLLGIKHVLVAVNKMDLVDYSETVFEDIKRQYRAFSSKLDLSDVTFVPLSALVGDNVVEPSPRMPWYQGATLMHQLENVHIASDENLIDLRFPVQLVLRPDASFRGFAGTLASGIVRVGDAVAVLPSGRTSRIRSIETWEGERQTAHAPMSVALTLEDEVDVSRGDMIVHPNNRPRIEQSFEAMVVWMSDQPMAPGREYLIKQTTRTVSGRIAELRYGIDVNTMHRVELDELQLNQIGRCRLTTTRPLFVDPYRRNRATGAFILIDRLTNNTVGAGTVVDRLPGASDHWDALAADTLEDHASPVTAAERNERYNQRPATVLLSGLTRAGKSTIASALERRLFDSGQTVVVLDGQQFRRGLSKDLCFSSADRSENLRRFASVAALLNHSGVIVIGAFVAPNEAVRRRVAQEVGPERFVHVHVDCPVDVCRARDGDGMYARADSGEIDGFPGVSAEFERPAAADLTLVTDQLDVDACVGQIVALLTERGFVADA